ncbi:MAG: glycosyltransferase family 4 protein, partial [Candidatus Hodarchaeota archaeon]
ILHVCHYQPKKNTETLIEAFSIVKKNLKQNKYKLVITGRKGKAWNRVSKIIYNKSLENDVIHLGNVPLYDLVLLYNCAEVFVFPSLHESFGLPILEAMSCGCPVITSNIYSLPEIAGDSAILIDPYDSKELSAKIFEVITDEELRTNLSRKGLLRAKMFTWKHSAIEHLKVYEKVYDERI